MTMTKFLLVDTYYPEFLTNYYARHPGGGNIFRSLFGTSDFYSQALIDLGQPAKTIVVNDWRAQSRWAAKHLGGLYRFMTQPNWLARNEFLRLRRGLEADILRNQVRNFRPDVIYFLDISYFPPEFLLKLRRSNCLLLGQIASIFPKPEFFQPFDLIISSLPNILNRVKRLGVKTFYQPLAFAPEVLSQLEPANTRYLISHIGGYGPIHQERNQVLSYAAKHLPVDFWGYAVDSLSQTSPIRQSYHGEIWGKSMYQILADSKMTITKHIRSVAGPYANNMTLYEATGCGTMLITDKKKNLSQLFRPERELITYTSPAELVEKAKYYLKHETKRQKIAAAGQSRTLEYHTYRYRMKELLGFLVNTFEI